MKIYRGVPPHTVTVENHNGALSQPSLGRLPPRLDLRNHSPTGFSWGYYGSGPAQLALALLADIWDDGTAQRFYQTLKNDLIGTLPMGEPWELTEEQIKQVVYDSPAWLEAAKP